MMPEAETGRLLPHRTAAEKVLRTGRFAAKTGEKHIPVFTLKSERVFI